MDVDRDLALPVHPSEDRGDASGTRGHGRFRSTRQDVRCNVDALLDKDQDWRDKGIRQGPALNACVH